MPGLIDTHLHLARPEFDPDREAVHARALEAGVCAFLQVGYDRESIESALAVAAGRENSWCSAGIHPHDASSYDAQIESELEGLAKDDRIVAVGECGLDFYRDLSPRPAQHEAFARQIDLATRLELPMIFHVRDAYDEARAQLIEQGLPPRRGVFHAFAGDADFARWAVGEGFALGIGGPLSYRRSRLPEAVAGLPPESFLLETDAPWLPPQPWRGKRNEPAYLRAVADQLAEICGISTERLAQITGRRFEQLFGVQLSQGFWSRKLPRDP